MKTIKILCISFNLQTMRYLMFIERIPSILTWIEMKRMFAWEAGNSCQQTFW